MIYYTNVIEQDGDQILLESMKDYADKTYKKQISVIIKKNGTGS